MKNNFLNMRYLQYLLMAMLLVSCGYKPSSHYIKNVFTDAVYVEVMVDGAEPENAPFVKDEMNRLIYTRFKGKVISKELSSTQILITYAGSSFIPLAYKDGYITRYRAQINTKFDMTTKQGREQKIISAVFESDIHASSLTSSTLRTEAIRNGLAKALDEFLAYVSAKGMLEEEKRAQP